ncbi:hypothetical protein N566_00110 [Streptomycetaceae bacterium MP113-05]|nr:hypothetical protein N566_00110 [Streptomycetaceae bacterium MP113-05]
MPGRHRSARHRGRPATAGLAGACGCRGRNVQHSRPSGCGIRCGPGAGRRPPRPCGPSARRVA